jgi:hypothetical protein
MPVSPLDLPEIVGCVLEHLDSESLVAAAQVNSLWAEEATNVRRVCYDIFLVIC